MSSTEVLCVLIGAYLMLLGSSLLADTRSDNPQLPFQWDVRGVWVPRVIGSVLLFGGAGLILDALN